MAGRGFLAVSLVVLILLGVFAVLLNAAGTRSRIAQGIGAGVGMLFAACLLYVIAIGLALSEPCNYPNGRQDFVGGLDKPISPWPPGAKCPPF